MTVLFRLDNGEEIWKNGSERDTFREHLSEKNGKRITASQIGRAHV